jgi:hypothetical protein
MTSPAWGITQGGGGFQNALATGLQFGQMARQRAEEKEYKNALAGYDPSNPETIKPIMAADPRVGIQLQRDAAEQQAKTQQADIQRRAAQGDPQAMAQLAGIDFGAWRGLQADQKAAAKERSGVLGNAALDVLNRPPEQRAAAWDAYIDQLSQTMPELAQYRGQYNEQSARSVIAQAEMIGKLHEMEQPDYMAIPAGGTLVDTNNPQAVQQFGRAPQPGVVEDGYRFKGGNPADPNAWEPVAAGGAGSGQQGFQR